MKAEAPFGMFPRFITPFLSQAHNSVALIYVELLTYRNSEGLAWPGQDRIARRTGFDPSTVKRAFRWLRNHSLIREAGWSSSGTKRYYIPLSRKELPIVASTAAVIDGEVAPAPPTAHDRGPATLGMRQGSPLGGGVPAPQTDNSTEEHSAPLDEVGEQIFNSGLLGGLMPRSQRVTAAKLSQRCAERGIPARQLEELFQRGFREGSLDPLAWFIEHIRGGADEQ